MLTRLLCAATFSSALMTVGIAADFESGLRALTKGDYATAFKEFAALAERGDDLAQYNLAAMYYRGEGVAQNYKEAAKLFRLSAQQGNAQAQYFLANMLSEGKGLGVDKPEAAKWYRLAAEQELPLAELKLSMAYDSGDGVPRDLKEWAKWNQRAADHGVPFAQFTQGARYWLGDGVTRDKIQAYKWFTLCINVERRCALRREDVAKGMSPSQITEAERLVKDWKPTGSVSAEREIKTGK